MKSISTPIDSPGLLPIANAIGKDLMLDVSPQLHPSVFVGQSANQVKYQHWIDQDIHCEDCLRLEIPNTENKIGAAFSSRANYNFEEATKVTFYVMTEDEEGGASFSFKAVGNDRDDGTTTNVPADDLFKNQEFALTSQNVTLNQSWNYFEMSLEGVQEKLVNVKYPFAFELEQSRGDIIYFKGIVYSNEPMLEQYALDSSDNMTASTMAITTTTTNATALNVTLSDNSTETVNAPATVEFNATVADGEEPYSFDWDFGDGGARDTEDTDGNAIHTFATPGLYNVTVDVADSLNNTGSANTMVDVAEDQTVDDQPAITSEDNSTQDSQPTTGALNNTNTTSSDADTGNEIEEETAADGGNGSSTDALEDEEILDPTEGANTDDDDGSANDMEVNNTDTGTGIETEGNSAANNSPPIANAGNDLIGRPNEQIILDASKSSDPDAGDSIVSYQWEQESGPGAEMNDQNSPTPIVTLPDVDEDSTIVFSLTVNDGSVDSEEEDTVSIFVDYVDQLTNSVQQRVLQPADITESEWIPSEGCEGQDAIQCLSDGSHATFVAAGTENLDSVSLYSFGGFSEEGAVIDPNSLVIERVVAEITVKKLGNTGYISFAVDDPGEEEHYFTASNSIGSNSFQKYYQVWDTNPVTGERWTYDSLNSLTAGFKYDGGQSGVQISELQLTVSYSMPAPAPAPLNDQVTAEEDVSDSGANENDENGENGTNGVQDTNQEEPAIETNSTNGDGADANDAEGDDNSEQEE